ncbi:hypothetical protein UPYG_G00220430 [Umbra pygmaea]|uniref:F-box domain-containing protein n=1 Tax=Umbra pygmaea TaxID=75934 RepID=A0ABD0WBE3_UMBPY
MAERCESVRYCSTTVSSHSEPRNLPSPNLLQSACWVAAMHLKPYPKQQTQEPHRESCQDSQRAHHRVSQHEAPSLRIDLSGSGLGLGTVRSPLATISPNTLQCNNNCSSNTSRLSGPVFHSSTSWARRKPSESSYTSTSSLLLLSTCTSSTCSENQEATLGISYQGEDGESPLDIWAVIKPGNTKEKIAIFASPQCRSGDEPFGEAGDEDFSGSPLRTMSVKMKSSWEDEGGSVAKRRRRSGRQGRHRHQHRDAPEPHCPLSPTDHSPREGRPSGLEYEEVDAGGEQGCRVEGETGTGKALSVVELVAFLEQRVSDKPVESKPMSLRSSTSITLSRGLSVTSEASEQSPPGQDEEAVKVSDMVAKLESECLKQQNVPREGSLSGGELSRNNSLRRKVGRVLLAGADACSMSAPPPVADPQDGRQESMEVRHLGYTSSEHRPVSSTTHTHKLAPSSLPGCARRASRTSDLASGTHSVQSGCGGSIRQPEERCEAQEGSIAVESRLDQSELDSCSRLECKEPLPGMLFFSRPPASQPGLEQQLRRTLPHTDSTYSSKQSTTKPGNLALNSPPAEPTPSENWVEAEEKAVSEGDRSATGRCEAAPVPLRRMVSHEFLEVRFKIQKLLEPQQYMAFLPHHVMVKIFCLLPTKSLAALKCTSHYFKSLIESYGVRPADSRWVCDPRYKDDPCKQCKKRYGRGDVSLCRWHHKPYCQALPYGPGYWMCCHGSHKNTPGCNVGLHDNRWVPAFHSMNMPIYNKPREVTED